jgi:hypothetical protein
MSDGNGFAAPGETYGIGLQKSEEQTHGRQTD